MEVWLNSSCSKSARVRAELDRAGIPYRIQFYLDQPPSAAELTDVLTRLNARPWDICRLQEPAAVARGMADWPREDEEASRWIEAMVAAPAFTQRPILLLDDGSAFLGRTPEAGAAAIHRATAITG